jgi:hypothetical protein
MGFSISASAGPFPMPLALSVPDAVLWSGLSRSEIYRRLKSGDIRAKKSRTRTLIVANSLRDWIDGLPNMG